MVHCDVFIGAVLELDEGFLDLLLLTVTVVHFDVFIRKIKGEQLGADSDLGTDEACLDEVSVPVFIPCGIFIQDGNNYFPCRCNMTTILNSFSAYIFVPCLFYHWCPITPLTMNFINIPFHHQYSVAITKICALFYYYL